MEHRDIGESSGPTGASETARRQIVYLRAHRVFNPRSGAFRSLFHRAILGTSTPAERRREAGAEQIMVTLDASADYMLPGDPPLTYLSDLYGPEQRHMDAVAEGAARQYQTIADLPDDGYLSLGPARDTICRSAYVGRHCLLCINSQGGDVISGERRYAEELLKFVETHTQPEEGADYWWETMNAPVLRDGVMADTAVSQLLIRKGVIRQAMEIALRLQRIADDQNC